MGAAGKEYNEKEMYNGEIAKTRKLRDNNYDIQGHARLL